MPVTSAASTSSSLSWHVCCMQTWAFKMVNVHLCRTLCTRYLPYKGMSSYASIVTVFAANVCSSCRIKKNFSFYLIEWAVKKKEGLAASDYLDRFNYSRPTNPDNACVSQKTQMQTLANNNPPAKRWPNNMARVQLARLNNRRRHPLIVCMLI